jgi:hypothetical protein
MMTAVDLADGGNIHSTPKAPMNAEHPLQQKRQSRQIARIPS